MGMYVCPECAEEHGLKESPGAATGHAACEICGPLKGDYAAKLGVIWTTDITRMYRPSEAELVQMQLENLKATAADVVRIRSQILEDGKGLVNVAVPDNWSFKRLMMACEYLLWVTAVRSPAGFEKALELLCRGATTYRNAQDGQREADDE